MNTLEYIGSIGGIAGVMSFLIFCAYKALVSQMREDRKFMEDRLTTLIKDYNTVVEKNQCVIVDHTRAITELTTYLKVSKNGTHEIK